VPQEAALSQRFVVSEAGEIVGVEYAGSLATGPPVALGVVHCAGRRRDQQQQR
jgi:hypothetical protein